MVSHRKRCTHFHFHPCYQDCENSDMWTVGMCKLAPKMLAGDQGFGTESHLLQGFSGHWKPKPTPKQVFWLCLDMYYSGERQKRSKHKKQGIEVNWWRWKEQRYTRVSNVTDKERTCGGSETFVTAGGEGTASGRGMHSSCGSAEQKAGSQDFWAGTQHYRYSSTNLTHPTIHSPSTGPSKSWQQQRRTAQ